MKREVIPSGLKGNKVKSDAELHYVFANGKSKRSRLNYRMKRESINLRCGKDTLEKYGEPIATITIKHK
jgi:hypothetical protein